MGKRFGLIESHADVIDEYMEGKMLPIGSQQLIYNLYDNFKRSVPTRRQVGTYLNLNPDYIFMMKKGGVSLYIHSSSLES